MNRCFKNFIPILLLTLLGPTAALSQIRSTWNNDVGNWNDNTKWSTADFPENVDGGNEYSVEINAGVVTLRHDIEVNGLDFNGDIINGGHQLTLAEGPSSWTKGTLSGSVLQSNGHLLFSGSETRQLTNGSTLSNGGQITFTGDGLFRTFEKSVINNQSGATFSVSGNFAFSNDANHGEETVFNNFGIFNRFGATGETCVGIELNNPGTVNVNEGTLILSGRGTSTGTINVNGGQLVFNNYHLGSGSSLNASQLEIGGLFSDIFVDLESSLVRGIARFNAGSQIGSLELRGGRLEGGNTTTVTKSFTSTDGRIDASRLQIEGSSDFFSINLENGAEIFNAGHSTWVEGRFRVDGSSAIVNQASGTIELVDGVSIFNALQNSRIDNAGKFIKSGSNRSPAYIGVAFNNTGTVSVTNGSLEFKNFKQATGSLIVGEGTMIESESPLDILGGEISGSGIISADINLAGKISPGSAGMLAINGNVSLGDESELSMEIGGLEQTIEYDFLNIAGELSLGGRLSLDLIDGFRDSIELGDTFTLASANVVSGSFENVADGGTLRDGNVAFDVHYPASGQSLVVQVASISSVPEPSSIMSIMLGGTGVALIRRRKPFQFA